MRSPKLAGASRALASRLGRNRSLDDPKCLEENLELVEQWLCIPATLLFTDDEDALTERLPGKEKCTDPDFPPAASSLYREGISTSHKLPANISWERMSGSLYKGSPQLGGGIIKSMLDNTWFLGALAMVASNESLLLDLLVSDDKRHDGLYTVQFYKHGEWRKVVVDDHVPCLPSTTKPIFARSTDGEELWVSLVEKAYAKLHGCYTSLEGGSVTEALVDLTGGCAYRLSMRDVLSQEDASSGRLWSEILEQHGNGNLIGCSFSHKHCDGSTEPNEGILQRHIYCIRDARETSKGLKLVKLYDPWGLKVRPEENIKQQSQMFTCLMWGGCLAADGRGTTAYGARKEPQRRLRASRSMAWKKLFLIGPMEVNAWTAGSNGPTEMCGVIPEINGGYTSGKSGWGILGKEERANALLRPGYSARDG
ncbi:hypothetical protein CBR_g23253 [Chara braunii]|uniref:Calpain catalytic domain-containing protein n=1 Tax=Chara braunii TaxID=69332 RepID=A0A388JVB8_CHABU|nr:hypothetical protein CBR_g23253 [Chara braunii]|eukprot:GBG61738.1 hypothetical protein CBR_g23253 [Chara braunii]